MARIDVEEPSEFQNAVRSLDVRTKGALPIAGLTYATRLLQAFVVEDDPLGTGTVQYAQDQSTTARGILIQDQAWLKDAALSLDENTKLTYVWDGPARCHGIAPIAKNDRLVCGPLGYLRTFNAGVGDTENMVVGRAKCGITVTGDLVDVDAMFQHSGV